uniref:Uncharacterized protein n=1 Tax=Mustela putorius furo TaxID=9669 RepID=M3XLV4_MUSPF
MPAEDGADDANEEDHQLRQELPREKEGERESDAKPRGRLRERQQQALRCARAGPPSGVGGAGPRGRALTTGPASATSAAASRRTSGGRAPRRPRRQTRQPGTSGGWALSRGAMAAATVVAATVAAAAAVAADGGSMLARAVVPGRRRWAGGPGPAPPRAAWDRPTCARGRGGGGGGRAPTPGTPPPTVAVRRPPGARSEDPEGQHTVRGAGGRVEWGAGSLARTKEDVGRYSEMCGGGGWRGRIRNSTLRSSGARCCPFRHRSQPFTCTKLTCLSRQQHEVLGSIGTLLL